MNYTDLVIQSTSETDGKIFYKPIMLQCTQESQYNEKNPPERHAWRFDGLDGYWQCRMQPLVIGTWYHLRLASKMHGTDKPYLDVTKVEEASPDEIPDSPPAQTSSPQNGFQSQPRPTRPDGEEIFRSKEELRWTEACHMATSWLTGETLGDKFLDTANWFYGTLATGPDPIREDTESDVEELPPYEVPEGPPDEEMVF